MSEQVNYKLLKVTLNDERFLYTRTHTHTYKHTDSVTNDFAKPKLTTAASPLTHRHFRPFVGNAQTETPTSAARRPAPLAVLFTVRALPSTQ